MNGKKARALRQLIALGGSIPEADRRRLYQQQKRLANDTRRRQYPTLTEPRRRLHPAPIKPTWPHTPDQARQGRPLIVKHPVRMFAAKMKDLGLPLAGDELLAEGARPKHELDRQALAA